MTGSRNQLLILALLVAATFLPLAATVHFFDRGDCIEYLELARDPSFGRKLPLYSILIAGANHLVPDLSLAAKLLTRALGSALVLATYALAAELFGGGVGLLAALLLATCPLGLFLAGVIHPITLLALLLVVAVHALVRHLAPREATGRLPSLLVANIAVGLAGLTRPEGFCLLPLVLLLDLRAARAARWSPRTLALLLLALAPPATAVFWFLNHFWYGERWLETVEGEPLLVHASQYALGYLRALPSLLSYTAFPLALIGAGALLLSWRRRALDPSQRAFLLVGGWTLAALFGGLCVYYCFNTPYAFSAVPFLLILAALGIDRVARRLARARPRVKSGIVAALVVVVLAVNLPLAAAQLKSYDKLQSDYYTACLWLKDRVETRPNGRKDVVVAADTAHFLYWTDLAALPYERAFVDKARYVLLTDIVLQHFGRSFDEEVDWLTHEKKATVIFRSETTFRPLVAIPFCQPYSLMLTPGLLDVRYAEHRFRSAVLAMPRPTTAKRE